LLRDWGLGNRAEHRKECAFVDDRLESTPSARDLPGYANASGVFFRIGCRCADAAWLPATQLVYAPSRDRSYRMSNMRLYESMDG
jgi:hypothetical protein